MGISVVHFFDTRIQERRNVMRKRVIITSFILFFAILSITCPCGVFSLSAYAKDNATITGDGLRIRGAPNTSSEVLGKVNKGTRVEALAHTDETDSIDGFTGYWYKINYKEITGYVFGKYIKVDRGTFIPSESELTSTAPVRTGETALLEDILGDWPMYFDAPNITFSFYDDGKAKYVETTYVGGGERIATYPPVWGNYTFDGKLISVNWEDGDTSSFVVEKSYGVTHLTIDGIMLPPELHMLGPGETLEYD